jgi:hypothetical protein
MTADARVFGGVTIRRAVAAQCRTTRLTCSQMNPLRADLHTLFANAPGCTSDGRYRCYVSASFLSRHILFSCYLR